MKGGVAHRPTSYAIEMIMHQKTIKFTNTYEYANNLYQSNILEFKIFAIHQIKNNKYLHM